MSMPNANLRPHRLIVIAGTATEIGKTWVSVALLARLRASGWTVAARKPAQSGIAGEPTDADALAEATGERVEAVCRPDRSYAVPMAPPMAAEATGRPVPTLEEFVREQCENGFASWGPRRVDVGVVELAGGVASPAALDADGADLAAAIEPDGIVVVADAGLGTINSVRLSVGRIRHAAVGRSTEVAVYLNRFDPTVDLHLRNREWLGDRDGFTVLCDPAELESWVLQRVAGYCGSCGELESDCDGTCARPLDPKRFCGRCGRRLVVSISPAGHSSRCKVHANLHE